MGPRIRTVKPEITASESLSRCSRDARLLFLLLITQADDEGRLRGSAALIRAQCYPYDGELDTASVDGWLGELDGAGKVRRYTVGDDHFLDIPGWAKHQRVDHPRPSSFPAFREDSREPRELSREPREEPREDLDRDRDLDRDLEGISGDVSPHPSVALAERPGPVEAVFDEWKQATGRNGRTVLDGKRRTVIARALKTHGEATVLAAVRGWVNDPWPERPLHTDVSVLLRDPAHIEKFAGLWQHGPPSPTVATNPIDARVDRMMGAGR